jgi:hypothetical protein
VLGGVLGACAAADRWYWGLCRGICWRFRQALRACRARVSRVLAGNLCPRTTFQQRPRTKNEAPHASGAKNTGFRCKRTAWTGGARQVSWRGTGLRRKHTAVPGTQTGGDRRKASLWPSLGEKRSTAVLTSHTVLQYRQAPESSLSYRENAYKCAGLQVQPHVQ